ncbi:S24 family peptidase [Methyloversatilis sp. XJ19-49]|uniref:S24 family peptidase n=1 Tax=Methyloversatilis sp. XJ19-49 TaxID=2963429 RepID=UPI00211C2D9D|nr:S24 family peptidase [Methyloversatilis sp. XJ19-49]MCQ9378828.1 hypothetical protein [Methyloversatilis sp. XJ19-49]
MDREQRKEHRRQRFIALIDEKFGGNQARFESKTGVAASLASRYISGSKGIGEDMKAKIEEQAGVPGWFDDSESTAELSPERGLQIDVLSVSGSMGFGEPIPDHETVINRLNVELEWVRKHLPSVSSPGNLKVISGYGDSMAPTYNDGDILLVDTGVRSVMIDGVYVLSAHNRLYIKRVRQRMDGQFEVSSDNPTVKTVDVLNGEHEVTVHGRVMWAWNGRKL